MSRILQFEIGTPNPLRLRTRAQAYKQREVFLATDALELNPGPNC